MQQHLVALAVNLQLAVMSADADPAAVKALLQEMGRDVEQALDETARLAQRIYPPLLTAGSLAAALRSAAASAGVRIRVDVAAGASYPPEVMVTVYLCWLAVLEQAGRGARATAAVREEEGTVAFEVVADGARSANAAGRPHASFDRLRDRVEALGGRLTVRLEPGPRTRVSGSLPLSG